MTQKGTLLADKINELEQEMKHTGLWQKEAPSWVNYFEEKIFSDGNDFTQWLQYVFIPNHTQTIQSLFVLKEKKLIAPSAINFFGDDVQKGKLLRILIELDSLL